MRLIDGSLHRLQMEYAGKIVDEFHAYAKSIGCVVGEGAMWDCIECTAEQSRTLTKWWNERTKNV